MGQGQAGKTGPRGAKGDKGESVKNWGEWTQVDKYNFINLLATNADFRATVQENLKTDVDFRQNILSALNTDRNFRTALALIVKDDNLMRSAITDALKGDIAFQNTVRGAKGAKGDRGDRGAVGPAGGITLKQVNEEIKKNSMWCADGTVCKIPKNFRLEKNFSMHPDKTFQIDEPNIPGGRVNINKDGIVFGKPVRANKGLKVNGKIFTPPGSNLCNSDGKYCVDVANVASYGPYNIKSNDNTCLDAGQFSKDSDIGFHTCQQNNSYQKWYYDPISGKVCNWVTGKEKCLEREGDKVVLKDRNDWSLEQQWRTFEYMLRNGNKGCVSKSAKRYGSCNGDRGQQHIKFMPFWS